MTSGALPGILFVFTYNGLALWISGPNWLSGVQPVGGDLTLQLVQTPIVILGQQLPRYLLTLNRLGWLWPDLLVLTILFWPRTGWGKMACCWPARAA